VPYDADLEQVERVTLEVAREQLALLTPPDTFEPYLRFQEFGNENVKLTAYLRAGEFVDQFKLRSDFMKSLRARYHSEGIRAPFPARTSEAIAAIKRSSPAALSTDKRSFLGFA